MLRVGLTGGIASGKSEVSARLAAHGAVVIDADLLAREVVAAGTDGFAAVVDTFGADVVGPDGELDRAALARLAFADDDARRRLEAIVHPRVRARARELEASVRADAVVVHDIPLLVETAQQGDFDVVVVVDAADEIRVQRLTSGRGWDPAHARARIAAQAERDRRLAAADAVVHNDGPLTDLDHQVDALWRRLQAAHPAG